MTLCLKCGKDRPIGRVNQAGDFVCGGCNPAAAAGQRRDFGRGRPRP